MEKGHIEDRAARRWYSIKIQFNSEEQWTKALKFMLVTRNFQKKTIRLFRKAIDWRKIEARCSNCYEILYSCPIMVYPDNNRW